MILSRVVSVMNRHINGTVMFSYCSSGSSTDFYALQPIVNEKKCSKAGMNLLRQWDECFALAYQPVTRFGLGPAGLRTLTQWPH